MKYLALITVFLLASSVYADEAPPVGWTYNKGFVGTSKDGQFKLKIGLKAATRLELNYSKKLEDIRGRFLLPRTRLILKGFAWGEKNTFKLEYDFSNRGYSVLKDYYLERTTNKSLKWRIGQYKLPFNRQEITGDFVQAFNERSLISGFSGSGRDIGLMLHNGYEQSPDGKEWAIGIFNGSGDQSNQYINYCWDPTDARTCTVGQPSNIPTVFQPLIAARLGYNHGGIKGYSELDLEGGPLRFALGASYKVKLGYFAGERYLEHAAEADSIIKLHGLDISNSLFAVREAQKLIPTIPEISKQTRWGFLSQTGYLVIPKKLALVSRFAIIPSETSNKNLIEMLSGMDFLYEGHAYKIVIDGGILHDTSTHLNNILARAQVQLTF